MWKIMNFDKKVVFFISTVTRSSKGRRTCMATTVNLIGTELAHQARSVDARGIS
jgi:hypothetical protein